MSGYKRETRIRPTIINNIGIVTGLRDAYTITTQKRGDGSEACYVVYFERKIVATFPINDPATGDAREYAIRFAGYMNKYYRERVTKLVSST